MAETRELDEDTLLDIDADGNLCGLTLEHARERADMPHVTFEQVAARSQIERRFSGSSGTSACRAVNWHRHSRSSRIIVS